MRETKLVGGIPSYKSTWSDLYGILLCDGIEDIQWGYVFLFGFTSS